MPTVATQPERHVGKSVGSGQCVGYVREVTGLPPTSQWRRGVLARGADLAPGTAISTFGRNGRYPNSMRGDSHCAILLEETADGLRVLDQWIAGEPRPVSERVIRFHGGQGKPINDADCYYAIEIDGDG